ncbi:DUF4180 domain-containing protein [Umezawaea endophytica]|uniref:DUF4180 domain-containing protein n=1 Tax=Umezawaea endophytica TaxID=1654476 RepID=A0A9X2VMX2_9PSEU|nr:DUF4180 domain-containing protein [Umezawaea endophytica]MCS7479601.1 DUF4180 domain-containing protein [Umezawaea endophytica]
MSDVLRLPVDGPVLRGEQDAVDVIGEAWSVSARTVVVPVQRLDEAFWTLSTRVAGAILGKFAAYRMRVVVVGDISGWLAGSESLRAFVREANRGREISFVESFDG